MLNTPNDPANNRHGGYILNLADKTGTAKAPNEIKVCTVSAVNLLVIGLASTFSSQQDLPAFVKSNYLPLSIE